MSIALIIVLVFGVNVAGGVNNVVDNAQNLAGYLSFTNIHDPITKTSSPYGLLTIVSMLAWGLGYFGMPHILLRFMAIEDENKVKISRRVATIWVVISLCVAVLIGIIGLGISKNGKIEVLTGTTSETLIVRIADLLSKYGLVTAIMAGIILAGILASTMSTSDSQLLAASSSVSQNLLQDTFRIKMSNKASMLAARLTVVVISIIAVIIASSGSL